MDEHHNCAICLNQIVDKKMLPCKHIYCVQCLVDYVTFANKNMLKKRCPLCSKGFQEIGKDYEAADVSSHDMHVGYVDIFLELYEVDIISDDEMEDVPDESSSVSDVMWVNGTRNDEPSRTLENDKETTDQPPHMLGHDQAEVNEPLSEICNNELIADSEDSQNEEDVTDAENDVDMESDLSSLETDVEDELENEDN
ncbi:uncharacterized protein LOC119666293 [Teleopsis dalmanni]|uniref:uncharacterized protein LOC119663348 n=1 Tax=Teleopsis dalmanni TaxID=139649 RepID=UPI000D32B1F1|nr:uncharacterized protein LOC119663348 [Teleopsis dalmanni]XP_037930164.1 uncharacterized protein LOC119664873 [Teleopsis dalmanni]XP_037931505.1 uncharacterized protein LOC119666293 [Teleopsis dalmanni]